tara:strand:- start:2197 stop:3129 length:933 start_codon:yes stop_codon:yes gene_type:complete
MSNFEKDIDDLFNYRRGGHVQHWLYTTQEGASLWHQFTQSSRGYYIPRDETALIQGFAPKIAQTVRPDVIIDFGPGGKEAVINKAMPVLRASGAGIYTGIDISENFLIGAGEVANDNGFKARMIKADFGQPQINLPNGSKLGLLFGCAITNQEMLEDEEIPREKIITALSDFNRHLGIGASLLVTYDNNPNKTAALAYKHKYWSAHCEGLMKQVDQKLKIGGDFDPQSWKHEAHWNSKASTVQQILTAQKPQTLITENANYHFSAGQRFVVCNNIKFSKNEFKTLSSAAGFSQESHAKHNTLRLDHLKID